MGYRFQRQPIAGESYVRCSQVVIDNPLSGPPRVTYAQETIVGTGTGQVLHIPMQPVGRSFEPGVEIAVLDPETGEPTGETITQSRMYALIYSAYLAAVTAAEAQPEEAV
ncbi:hypothetical protein SAMN05421763_103262 [[Luteovulum] sphaeroides subsp. megalophilum]|uniref:hypothetical protein n=1 Tax=Cereibacter sphaeroides TaxID=1063 RepID=UPI000B68A628|nr:hypothetical protein [Cereibacter sphaeroides]SNS86444.1 hypothetical protein SAMN05421763_103262 [[Luteovulum] sphaeroides subsp. megalophilum]